MTRVRMLSPEVLARLVAIEGAQKKASETRTAESIKLLLVLPDPGRRKGGRAGRNHV